MYVTPQTLDLHLSEVKRYFELMQLDDWLHRAKRGRPLPRLACALTFDDGWRDNFEFALPVLRRHGAPATIFLVSSYVGSEQRFWPNRLVELVRKAFVGPGAAVFPKQLRPLVEAAFAEARRHGELRAEHADPVVEAAKEFDEAQIRSFITQAEEGCGGAAVIREILSGEEIAEMAATRLIRFGSHTATHYRFGGRTSSEELEREIVSSRIRLRDVCGEDVEVFCYPNGETSPDAIEIVRQNYVGAVTTRKGWHTASDDPYLIRRVGLHEDMSDTPESFLARVSTWL